MRRRSTPVTSPKVIAEVIKRHLAGESADDLAKEKGKSRASVYGWVAKYKRDILERSRREGMAPRDASRADKAELIAQVEALELENKQLRDRLIAMMLKADPLLSPATAPAKTPRRKPKITG
jgi:hypothetical protein